MQANKVTYFPVAYFIRNNLFRNVPNVVLPLSTRFFTAAVDTYDVITNDLLLRNKTKLQQYNNTLLGHDIKYYFSKSKTDYIKKYSEMSDEEIDHAILDLLEKLKHSQIVEIIKHCINRQIFISESTLKRLFRSCSIAGKLDVVVILQKYCSVVQENLYISNGQFEHYLAKAHCYKGNSEKGLSLLSICYTQHEGLRGFYRVIFRELIHDSVLNKSEASLVTFKKYVLEFSSKWKDHYPLVCFWHICWISTWHSDQMLANELFDTSESLQNIVKEKATTLTINILRDYNDDAVMRLLQSLLKYKMMTEYVSVLQVLFNFKLRNKDLRSCMEIVRNCEALGVTLPADQQGRYVRMLIENKVPSEKQPSTKIASKDFKLKF